MNLEDQILELRHDLLSSHKSQQQLLREIKDLTVSVKQQNHSNVETLSELCNMVRSLMFLFSLI